MSDQTKDAIYQAALDWIRTANGLGNNDVIRRDQHGPRPELPYATVKVTTHDIPVGTDEELRGESGDNATVQLRGLRRGQLSVQTYGGGSHWIEQARQYLDLGPVRRQLQQAGITFRSQGGTQAIGTILDPEHEPRHGADFQVVYQVLSPEVDAGPGAKGVAFDLEFPDVQFSDSDTLG